MKGTIIKKIFTLAYSVLLYAYTYTVVTHYLKWHQFKDFIWDVDWIRRNGPYKGENADTEQS